MVNVILIVVLLIVALIGGLILLMIFTRDKGTEEDDGDGDGDGNDNGGDGGDGNDNGDGTTGNGCGTGSIQPRYRFGGSGTYRMFTDQATQRPVIYPVGTILFRTSQRDGAETLLPSIERSQLDQVEGIDYVSRMLVVRADGEAPRNAVRIKIAAVPQGQDPRWLYRSVTLSPIGGTAANVPILQTIASQEAATTWLYYQDCGIITTPDYSFTLALVDDYTIPDPGSTSARERIENFQAIFGETSPPVFALPSNRQNFAQVGTPFTFEAVSGAGTRGDRTLPI